MTPHPAWLEAICSVLFDIDLGQRVETCYPESTLRDGEAADIAFSSFPDSMSMELHSRSSVRDSTFFFRVRRRPEKSIEGAAEERRQSGQEASTSDRGHYESARQEYLYGFVFCRQRQDNRLKRGGEQKSVVLLSSSPYSSVLCPLSQYAGPLYFNQGPSALEGVYEEVLGWEPPVSSARRMVRVGSVTLLAQVPESSTLPPPAPDDDELMDLADMRLEEVIPPLDTLQGVFSEVDVYTPLKAMLDRAWAIWEAVLLAEPLMVVAPSPGECSAAVAAMVSLINPLPYSADFRPYFTIHDSTFHQLSAQQLPNNSNRLPRLLGVTNLYFLKALPSWPNVLSTGVKNRASAGAGSGVATNGESRLAKLDQAVRRKAVGAQALMSQHMQALWLAYKPLTRPDKVLLERLLEEQPGDGPAKIARISSANSAALRKHFSQLTTALLQPFARFLQPVPPPPGADPVPPEGAPPLPAFSHADCLEALSKDSQLPPLLLQRFQSKAACIQFYRRFLECPNFSSWFERQRGTAAAWQAAVWARARVERGMGIHLEDSDEVQLVEAFRALEQRLEAATAAAQLPTAGPEVLQRVAALKKQVGSVYERMPRDLQTLVLSSPARASLMHRLSPNIRVPGMPRVLSSGTDHS